MKKYLAFIKDLVDNGGPNTDDFAQLNLLFNSLATEIKASPHAQSLVAEIRAALGEAVSSETIQGYGLQKPLGYPGDFLMIDKIYQYHTTANARLKNWDLFFHAQKAPIAVRNRKTYFIDLLTHLRNRANGNQLNILNLACGPCRDVAEYLHANNDANIHFHCVDADTRALEYAQKICADFPEQITFYEKNALRFRSEMKFDLVWSAGLTDYFTDKQFKFFLKRLMTLVHPHGEIVVGNFHPDNPSKDYMEIVGDWYLNYRSECDLLRLARDTGLDLNQLRVGAEQELVNLFLHVKSGGRIF